MVEKDSWRALRASKHFLLFLRASVPLWFKLSSSSSVSILDTTVCQGKAGFVHSRPLSDVLQVGGIEHSRQ